MASPVQAPAMDATANPSGVGLERRGTAKSGHRQGKLAYAKVARPKTTSRGDPKKNRSVVEVSHSFSTRGHVNNHGEVPTNVKAPMQAYLPSKEAGIRDVPYHSGQHAMHPGSDNNVPYTSHHPAYQQQHQHHQQQHHQYQQRSGGGMTHHHQRQHHQQPQHQQKPMIVRAPMASANNIHAAAPGAMLSRNSANDYINSVAMKNICNGNTENKLFHATQRAKIVEQVASLLSHVVLNNDKYHVPDNIVTRFHAEAVPNITVQQYIERIARYSPCSNEALYAALMYLDRVTRNYPKLLINSLNIHRFLITAIMLAGKYFDDFYFNNVFYARVGGVEAKEMNSLELEFLFLIRFDLHVEERDFHGYTHAISGFAQTCAYLPAIVHRPLVQFLDAASEAMQMSAGASPTSSVGSAMHVSAFRHHQPPYPSPGSSASLSSPTVSPPPHAVAAGMPVGYVTPSCEDDAAYASTTQRDSRWKFMV